MIFFGNYLYIYIFIVVLVFTFLIFKNYKPKQLEELQDYKSLLNSQKDNSVHLANVQKAILENTGEFRTTLGDYQVVQGECSKPSINNPFMNINQITDNNSKIDFLNYHLNDFLAVPIVLQLVLISFQLLYKNVNIYLGKDKILYTVIYISFFFELLLPYFSERFVGDWLDVIMYCLGGLAFFLFQKNSK
jgi:hypothetical protein